MCRTSSAWCQSPPTEPASPFLQRFNSFSSFWIMMVRLRFLSFSFSYFFFHSSAVSSKFTDTVFFIVLALEHSKQNRNLLEHSEEPWSVLKAQQSALILRVAGSLQ